MTLRIEIGRIVLDGVAVGDRRRFEQGFREAVAESLAGAAAFRGGDADGPLPVVLPRGAGAEAIGRALGRAVARQVVGR